MIATFKKFKFINNGFNETTENNFIGYTFSNNGQNYKAVCTSFTSNFELKEFIFVFSLYVQNNITSSWSFVENKKVIANDKIFRDENGNLFYDYGDNTLEANAYVYTNEPIYEGEIVINNQRIKTLKSGLLSEWDIFYNNIFLGICVAEINLSIINENIFGITEIN